MQIATGAGLFLGAGAAVQQGEVVFSGQAAPSEEKGGQEPSLFTLLLTAAGARAGRAADANDGEAAPDKGKDAAPEDGTDQADGLMAQLTLMQVLLSGVNQQNGQSVQAQALAGVEAAEAASALPDSPTPDTEAILREGLEADFQALLLQTSNAAAEQPAPQAAASSGEGPPAEPAVAEQPGGMELPQAFPVSQPPAAASGSAGQAQTETGAEQEQQLPEQAQSAPGTAPVLQEEGDIAQTIAEAMRASGGQAQKKQDEQPSDDLSAARGAALLQAAAPQQAEQGEAALAVERAVNQFLEDFRGAQTAPREIRIVLEPESLGTLTISVTSTADGITAKIRTERKEVFEQMTGRIQSLISALESKGMTIKNVDVTYAGEQEPSYDQQDSGAGRQDQQPRRDNGGRQEEEAFSRLWQTQASGADTAQRP